jgi:tripartite-type tricarboxylate transporter receptor subunit TctC
MRWKGAFVAATAFAPIALEANAQKWPARPIEMIIPFPAGSGVDVIGRAVASALADQSGQQVVVNNRDGASGTIGFNALAAATPDGSTIAFGPTTADRQRALSGEGSALSGRIIRLSLPDFRERVHHRSHAAVEIQIGA